MDPFDDFDVDDNLVHEEFEQDEARAAVPRTNSSKVVKFLQEKERLICKRLNTLDKKASHLMMDEGRSSKVYAGNMGVELSDMEAFHAAIIADMGNDLHHPIVERFPDIFKFAIDFDFKTEQKLKKEDKIKYAQTSQRAVRAFIDEGTFEHMVAVCTVEGDDRFVEGTTLFKDDIHQIWPMLHVNHSQAVPLVTKVILPAMKEHHSEDGIDWGATLDTSIYHNGKGLRPLSSNKRQACKPCALIGTAYSNRRKICGDKCKWGAKCVHCKPETRTNKACKHCQGTVIIYGGDQYYVVGAVLKPDGEVDAGMTMQLQDDCNAALKICSVIPVDEETNTSFEFECEEVNEKKRKATTKSSVAAKKLCTAKVQLSTDEVVELYKAAGGTLELQDIPDASGDGISWRELSPGHDERPCL
jgi:hypothetical protein